MKINKNKKNAPVKSRQGRKTTHEIVVRVEQAKLPTIMTEKDLEPVQDGGGKYMIPKSWMSEKQVLRIVQKTPPQHIYNRPGKGGQVFSYVTASYIEKVLNYTFGWNWDFEIVEHGKEGDQVWVKGKLTVKNDKGNVITKMQFGRADVKFLKGTKNPVDFGNDLKAASSDSLKKCASLLGIASDIYGKTEVKQETGYEVKPTAPQQEARRLPSGGVPVVDNNTGKIKLNKDQVIGPDGEPTYVCSVTGAPISDAEYEFSMKVFGRALSREAQKNYKPRK